MKKQLQHRLFHYEVVPPTDAWEKINSALDEETTYDFPEKLMSYEVDPPAGIWDAISVVLDQNKTPVVPITKRLSKPFRYGTVAASLIFAALLINLVISKRTASEEVSVTPETNNIVSDSPKAENNERPSSGVADNISTQTSNEVINPKIENKEVKILPVHAAIVTPNPRINDVVTENYPIVKSELLDRYSIFSSKSGETIRVSKKLFDLFLCSEKNEYCKLNIEMAKEQLASPSLLASADFSGVLDLLQNMNH